MRQLGKQPVHDLVIRSIPTLWEKNGQQFVEINAGSDRNVCAALPDVYPDVIGFAHQNGPTQLLWVAEVETEDNHHLAQGSDAMASICRIGRSPVFDCPCGLPRPCVFGRTARRRAGRRHLYLLVR